ncbi:MAG: protein translocase subunit SecF [Patescibacteria group bacterium]
MFIVRHRKFFYALSVLLVILAVLALSVWGLKPGIDFKGGSLVEVEYPLGAWPAIETIKANLDSLNLGAYSVRETGQSGLLVRTGELSPEMHEAVLIELSDKGIRAEEKRFNSIGPVLGREALQKSWISVIMVLIAIVLFITFAFRKVSEPVSSWKYALIAIVALIHDVVIPSGVFAFLGFVAGFETDTLFVTALLVILGFSVHDTIVVFDRVRENLRHDKENKQKKSFENIVGESINQTFVRSVNTSLTTLIAIFVLYLIGPEATRHFALTLIIGIVAGTYSSIFIGSPLLVTVYKWQDRKNK